MPQPLALGGHLSSYAMLRAFGWISPSSRAAISPERDPDGSPNHFREWASPIDSGEIAAVAVRTMIEALGVIHPGRLEYVAFHADGGQILLPGLGLKKGDWA